MTTEAFAPAKINLTLHVTAQRPDGYHMLDSLVVFADVGDRLKLTPAAELSLTVSGRFAAGVPDDARNLVWQAAVAAGWTGHIALEKNLPHGAGIGGGSADAAAVLRHLGHADLDTAEALGADVPVCLSAVPKRLQGIGEILTPLTDLPVLDIVLVNPGGHLPTPRVFAALEQKFNPQMDHVMTGPNRDVFVSWLARQRNDLEQPAIALAPQIADAMAALQDAELVRMSGSGATCFGIYPDTQSAQDAERRIAERNPDWWCVAARTIGARPMAVS